MNTLPFACSFKTAGRTTAHILKHLLHGKVTVLFKGVPRRHLRKLFLPGECLLECRYEAFTTDGTVRKLMCKALLLGQMHIILAAETQRMKRK